VVDVPRRVAAARYVTAALLVLAVVVGLLIGWFAGDHTAQDWVYAFSGSFEGIGLLLVAAPEVVTALRRFGAWVAAMWRKFLPYLAKVEHLARRLFRRPRHVVVHAGAASVVASGGNVTARVLPGEDKTLEEKVEYLLRRDQDMQARADSIELRMGGLASAWRRDQPGVGDFAKRADAGVGRPARAPHGAAVAGNRAARDWSDPRDRGQPYIEPRLRVERRSMASEDETQQGDDEGRKRDVSEKLSKAPGTDEKTSKKIEESLAEDEKQVNDRKADLSDEF
jgi:hypothetical protein